MTTLAVGALSLLALFAFERWAPRLPGGLILLTVAIAASAALELSKHGVDTVGHIPTGLPSVGLPHLARADLWTLIPSAAGLMLVIFSEALGAGQTFADKNGYRLEANQEMVAIGFANLGSGLLRGLGAGGSLSQTAVNDGAGARSQVSSIVAGALSLVTVLALTPLFTDLPDAVLAALIIHAVSHLMKVGQLRRFYQLMPREFWLGMLTLVSVITLNVLPALIIGVVTSILLLLYRASKPRVSVLGSLPSAPGVFVDVQRDPDARPLPGLLIVRPDATLFYANAQAVQDTILALAASEPEPVHTVLLDLDANDEIDITSTEALTRLATTLEAADVRLGLAHVHGPAMEMARRSGLLDHLGPDRVHLNMVDAVAWATSTAQH